MLGLSEPLRALVTRKFVQARNSSSLLFSETQVTVLDNSLRSTIQLRYCPALKSKPVTDSAAGKDGKSEKRKFDPFENPSPELLVGQIPQHSPTHNLVLNKYPVIPNHFILATKGYELQTGLLSEDDLYLTYSCLRSWEDDNRKDYASLFAFFNSGEHSGASQPHRHLQFLPVEDMVGADDSGWDLLCNSMTTALHRDLPLLHNPRLPFVHCAVKLHAGSESRAIHDSYILLLRAALASITDGHNLNTLDAVSIHQDGKTTFSYNLAMTTGIMAILPRRQEAAVMDDSSDGYVFVNGTILAGTMMVRAEDDWDRLRQDPELVLPILNSITFPPKQSAGEGKQNL